MLFPALYTCVIHVLQKIPKILVWGWEQPILLSAFVVHLHTTQVRFQFSVHLLMYPLGDRCIPAGTHVLSGGFIICPKHFTPKGQISCSVGWCFICSIGNLQLYVLEIKNPLQGVLLFVVRLVLLLFMLNVSTSRLLKGAFIVKTVSPVVCLYMGILCGLNVAILGLWNFML